jgi:hypothetical protein
VSNGAIEFQEERAIAEQQVKHLLCDFFPQ